MPTLKEKIQDALNENRMLILGAEVLLGFQYEAFFQSGFGLLSPATQRWAVGGLGLQLITIALLIAPTSFHQIVAPDADTPELHGFATRTVSVALLSFAGATAISMFVVVDRTFGQTAALWGAAATLLVACFFWYGLEFMARLRARNEGKGRMAKGEDSPLEEKIQHLLTEARIILPGAQALIGFQFIIFISQQFDTLPQDQKLLHLGSLASVLISTILVMAPAAYHRIVARGEATRQMYLFGQRMLLASMVFLALGITGDFLLVARKTLEDETLAFVLGTAVLAMFLGLWFVFMLVRRPAASGAHR